MQHPQVDESFLKLPSKVVVVMKLLHNIENACKPNNEDTFVEQQKTAEGVVDDSFMVTACKQRAELSKGSKAKSKVETSKLDKFTFMRQVDMNEAGRTAARLEREAVAQHFRKLGNSEYRNCNYDKAMTMFSKAIDYIKDSPFLYTNRALCYIKLGHFRRGIIDCDFVLNRLDEKNLRAWLYRGAAYKQMNDEANFDNCIKYARKSNSKQLEYIEKFLEKLQNEFEVFCKIE